MYLANGQVKKVPDFEPEVGALVYYEVVRLIEGRFLFLEDHLLRLRNSLLNSGLSYPGKQIILGNLKQLLLSNSIENGNIRICLQDREQGQELLCYFIPYHYPTTTEYQLGVQLITFSHERPSPGIKRWDGDFRTRVRGAIREKQAYEALLLNRRREITEGSRSNVFFVDRHNTLITPPVKHILPGITRNYVLKCARESGMAVLEEVPTLTAAMGYPACFISGTSPKVLPVREIDGQSFYADHPLVRKLMDQFELLVEQKLETIN